MYYTVIHSPFPPQKTYHSWPRHCYPHSHLGSYTSVIGCNSSHFYSLVGWLHKHRGQWEQEWGLQVSDLQGQKIAAIYYRK